MSSGNSFKHSSKNDIGSIGWYCSLPILSDCLTCKKIGGLSNDSIYSLHGSKYPFLNVKSSRI